MIPNRYRNIPSIYTPDFRASRLSGGAQTRLGRACGLRWREKGREKGSRGRQGPLTPPVPDSTDPAPPNPSTALVTVRAGNGHPQTDSSHRSCRLEHSSPSAATAQFADRGELGERRSARRVGSGVGLRGLRDRPGPVGYNTYPLASSRYSATWPSSQAEPWPSSSAISSATRGAISTLARASRSRARSLRDSTSSTVRAIS